MQEYHQQVHGFKAFRNWHSGQYPGQILEMEDWKRFESKEMAFPAFTRNVMYTMSFEVPSYFGSLTSSLSCTPSHPPGVLRAPLSALGRNGRKEPEYFNPIPVSRISHGHSKCLEVERVD